MFYLWPKLLNRIKKRWTYLGSPFSMNSLTVAGLYIGVLYIRMQWIFNLFLSKTSITLPKQLGKCLVLVSTFTVVVIAFLFLFPVTRVRFLRETPITPWLGIAPRMVAVALFFHSLYCCWLTYFRPSRATDMKIKASFSIKKHSSSQNSYHHPLTTIELQFLFL